MWAFPEEATNRIDGTPQPSDIPVTFAPFDALPTWPTVAVIGALVALAYVVFGVAGFGTALVAGPPLATMLPLQVIVPLLALLDLSASIARLARDGRRADRGELRRLVPVMLLGSGAGAMLLIQVRADLLLTLLGAFVMLQALNSLRASAARRTLSAGAAIPFGLIGGVFSALFGSGGFVYATYLASRLPDRASFAATQGVLIALSTTTRVVLFLLAGMYADGSIVLLALVLVPAMLAGGALGRRIANRLSRDAFVRTVNLLVLASGATLLLRQALR